MDNPQNEVQKPVDSAAPVRSEGWERQVLEKLAMSALDEQRVRRRWGVFFKLLGFAYLIAVLVMVIDWGHPETLADGKHTEVSGEGIIEGLPVIVRANRVPSS